ncbi:hypothetical protein DITRI_Ditri15bG0054100 [Diplodiscus trichospermus]
MKEIGAIYLTPFSHRLAEEIDNPEYQRLRCRVNYHALSWHRLRVMHIIFALAADAFCLRQEEISNSLLEARRNIQ